MTITALNSLMKHARGFTLIEAMVALVVLSVGMIGIAAMFGEGLTAGREAAQRSQAVDLVSDMADRIRANRDGWASSDGVPTNNKCDPQTGGGVDCTSKQMAAHDLYVWVQQTSAKLPNGKGFVNCHPTPAPIGCDTTSVPPKYTITVQWTATGQGQAASTVSYTTAIQVSTF